MKSLFRRSPPSHQVGLLLASDRILLACVEPVPIFTSRAINGPNDWPKAMGELFAQHGLAKSKVRVALAA
nr:MSHA biogenesis protein MshI [Aeromonas rivipollensis]